METGGTNLCGKLVEGHVARGVRCSTQLVPNISSLPALGNLCFHKHQKRVEAISPIWTHSDAKRWKALTKEKCEEKENIVSVCLLCPERQNIFKAQSRPEKSFQ